MERSPKLMEGIVSGIPKKSHRPVIDGIVCGVRKVEHPALKPDTPKVMPSATKSAQDVFGAGRTPQGYGNGRK
jgi:hypothetical protein